MEIRKIAIAIDGSPLSVASMDQAVNMACRINSDVDLIFIEDVNLKKIANFNHIKMISPFSSSNKSIIKDKELSDVFKSQKIRINNAINYAFKGKNLKHEFLSSEGVVEKEIVKLSKSSDLLVMAWAGWKTANYYFSSPYIQGQSQLNFPVLSKISLSLRAKEILLKKSVSTLVLIEALPKNSETLMYFDGSEDSMNTLKYVMKNVSKMLDYDDLPYESENETIPLNIVVDNASLDKLKYELKAYNKSANLIKVDKLCFDDLKSYIKKTKAKLFVSSYKAFKNLSDGIDIISDVPVSFMLVKNND
ncbi:MAG: hypothetical protein BWY78_00950 [Alphaproteobacteria bacterium ADurb.Bin438]|nr:MAG: hypothetical protein BWY78_00950 [Alphaproteobacteria bacterium ADurb.Bin438]